MGCCLQALQVPLGGILVTLLGFLIILFALYITILSCLTPPPTRRGTSPLPQHTPERSKDAENYR